VFSTRRHKRPSRRSGRDHAGQAAVELALVLPLLTLFTLLVVQFSVVARDQLALWQAAREITRDVVLAVDPYVSAQSHRTDDTLITIADGIVTVALRRRTHIAPAGFDFLRRSITLRARVSMALEPPVAFPLDVVGDEFPTYGP
jgi:hypothetical protein